MESALQAKCHTMIETEKIRQCMHCRIFDEVILLRAFQRSRR